MKGTQENMRELFEIKDTEHYDYPQLSVFFDDRNNCSLEKYFTNEKKTYYGENAIYIHVPFCKSSCIFCNYYKVFPKEELVEDYVKAVIKELRYYSVTVPNFFRNISAVHFGGGTPTALGTKGLKRIIEAIRANFTLSRECLISIEAHLRDMQDIHFLAELVECGINRVSFGVQSFSESIRKKYGLVPISHMDIAVENLHGCGINDINIDLMYNFPEQDSLAVIDDIERAFLYDVNCIDLYSLNVFPNTRMEKYLKKNGTYKKYNDGESKKSYYAIYNYIKEKEYNLVMSNTISKKSDSPNKYLEINLGSNKLDGGHVIGIGPSSRGYLNGYAYKNYSDLEDYISVVRERGNSRRLEQVMSEYERQNRLFVMFPNFTYIFKENVVFNEHTQAMMDKLINEGYVMCSADKYFIRASDCYWAGNISAMFYSDEQKIKMVNTLLLNKKNKLNMYNQDKMQIVGD